MTLREKHNVQWLSSQCTLQKVDLPAQGMLKGNLPTAPAAPTLTLAGTQVAADNPSEDALGQATREEAKLPALSLEIEPFAPGPTLL